MSKFPGLTRRQVLILSAMAAAQGTLGNFILPGKAEANAQIPGRPEADYIKSEEWSDKDVIDADLLIVGSGIAGLMAAINAADSGVKNIVIADRGSIGNSSVASMIMGATSHFREGDDITAWMQELIGGTGYLSRQDIWIDLLSTSPARVKKLEEDWGVKYAIKGLKSDGNKYVAMSIGTSWKNIGGGKSIIAMLLDQVKQRKGIRYYSKTFISKVLTNKGKAAGAIGVSRLENKAAVFRAKAVILAAGQCSFSGQHAMMEMMTGNGYALAYNAGATLNNMEFWTYDIDPGGYPLEGASLQGVLGCRILNNRDDDFMWKYDPEFGMDAHVRVTTRAMAQEVRAGRGPLMFDQTTEQYRKMGKAKWEHLLFPGGWQILSEKRLDEVGYDVTERLTPMYATSFGIIGAVKADVNCQSTVPGLYAAGVTISHDPGKIKGIESARAYWSGEKSGIKSAEYIRELQDHKLDMSYAEKERAASMAPLAKKGDLTPTEVLTKIQKVIFPYQVALIKNEDHLMQALIKIQNIKKNDLGKMYAENPHELIKYHETSNMLLCAELFLKASLERRETRECHYREDYPELNNNEWLKWINFNKGKDGDPVMTFERVPIEKYPLKPKEV